MWPWQTAVRGEPKETLEGRLIRENQERAQERKDEDAEHERQVEERLALKKQREEDEKAKLDEMKRDDAEALEKARAGDIDIPFSTSRHPNGLYLEFGKASLPVRFIESIAITDAGDEPGPYFMPFVPMPYFGARSLPSADIIWRARVYPAVITVTMASGDTKAIKVDRHAVPFVHEELVKAWKSSPA